MDQRIHFRAVESVTPLLSHYKIDSYRKPTEVRNVNINIYPHIVKRRGQVEELEKKLQVDLDREFIGQAEDQKLALNRLIEKNTRIRKRAGMKPGVGEKFETELYTNFLQGNDKPNDPVSLPFLIPVFETPSPPLSDGYESDNTDDLFDLEYPMQDIFLESAVTLEKVLDPKSIHDTLNERKRSNATALSLKDKYGELVDTNTGSQLAESNLEQEAVTAMKMGTLTSCSILGFAKLGN
jgi:hypothetical protein